jgi:hypothetical protein
MYDYKLRRRYQGKLLYFEQCLVYTESIHRKLEYRGHYGIKEFGLASYDAKDKFCLFGGRLGEHEVDFRANMSQMEEWYDILHGILMNDDNQGNDEGKRLLQNDICCFILEMLKLSGFGKDGKKKDMKSNFFM